MTDLTGSWAGSYIYPGSFDPVPFQAEIIDSGDRISGVTVEPGDELALPGEAHAVISGERTGSHVSFTKVYDQLQADLDPVEYFGTVDEDMCEISGEWSVPGWSGSFIMTRSKSRRADAFAEQKAAA